LTRVPQAVQRPSGAGVSVPQLGQCIGRAFDSHQDERNGHGRYYNVTLELNRTATSIQRRTRRRVLNRQRVIMTLLMPSGQQFSGGCHLNRRHSCRGCH
jgi:hypothetical protein